MCIDITSYFKFYYRLNNVNFKFIFLNSNYLMCNEKTKKTCVHKVINPLMSDDN